jgi:teichuronic acid exporter
MSAKSLRSSGLSGMLWSFSIQGGTQAINFVVTVLLARLLLPQQFGLIGMISIFLAISRALMDGGFVSSLIRTKEADNIDYSTVFFVNLISSIVLYGILFFLAPFIAQFYQESILVDLVRVLSLVLIINAFSLVQSTKLNKTLQFKTQFKLQIPSLIISAAVSIWMAHNNYGVWSLVAKDLVFSFLATLQLWWYAKWIPSFIFDKEKFKYHFNFGYKLSLTQIINTSFDNLYNVVIGRFFSAAQLGYFTRARTLEQLPTGFFYNSFNRVFYPLLAQVKDNDKQLKKVYSQLMKIVVFVVTPILVYLGISAEPFFRWLLTEKWLPAVPYFQLLLISGVFYPIHKYNLNICNLKGRSDVVLTLSMMQNFLLLLGAFSAIWLGIYGLLLSLIVVNISITVINAYFSGKLIGYGLKSQFLELSPIFLLNILLGLTFFFVQTNWFYKLPDLLNLMANGLCFFTLYFVVALLIKMKVVVDMFSFIRKKNG